MNSSAPSITTPAPDELELAIFGPGVGECIVLHLGNNEWMVIDSCYCPKTKDPVSLWYLSQIGVDPAISVKVVLATHWHDDHIQGLAETLNACPKASFVMSNALGCEEFFRLVLQVDAENRLVTHNSSASEFAEIFKILKRRCSSNSTGNAVTGPDLFAQDGTRLFQGGFQGQQQIWAISPSLHTVTNSLSNLASRMLTSSQVKRFKRFSPNDLSVALLVQSTTLHLLLGADLEDTRSGQFGWKAVLSSHLRPQVQSSTFKVPHHGSENAENPQVWTNMLASDPITIVTPFSKLAKPLPTASDIQRLKGYTPNLYCTTWPPTQKPPRRQGIDGIVNAATKSRRAINQDFGWIRLRVNLCSPLAQPQVSLHGEAKKI